jgi:multidrug efflux system outer membrane protein
MTSLAFVFDVVPLVLATGAGAAARAGMGSGVFGGIRHLRGAGVHPDVLLAAGAQAAAHARPPAAQPASRGGPAMKRAARAMLPALSALSALLLAACASGPAPQRPDIVLPAAYAGSIAASSPVLAADWWKLFAEPGLDQLVELALAANLDLRLAAARIDETAVALGLARAAQWPSVDANGSVSRIAAALTGQPVSPNGPRSTSHQVALTTSFEIDLWGRCATPQAAALLAAQHARDTVRLGGQRGRASRLGMRTLDAQQATVATQRKLRDDGRRWCAAALKVALRRAWTGAGRQRGRAGGIELHRQRELLVNQLGLLSSQPGLAAGRRARAPHRHGAGRFAVELLLRRPDLQQAEATMRASFARIRVTRKLAQPVADRQLRY